MLRVLFLLCVLLISVGAQADLKIFTCEPEWMVLAKEIGANKIDAYSATTAFQDPHYIQAKPSLIAKVRNANLVVCSGADLEIGWLPVLLQKANNRNVLTGTPGFFEASSFVQRVDVSSNVDRSQGDLHAQGNPHVQTSPHNIRQIAVALSERMGELDAGNAAIYQQNLDNFLQRWDAAIANWEKKAAPLRGKRMITHHKSWPYLQQWLGIEEVANLEPLPGVPPTTAHLSQLLSQFGPGSKNGSADFIVRSPYQDDRGSSWLSERTGIQSVVLPFTVGGSDAATDLFSLFDDTINTLLSVVK